MTISVVSGVYNAGIGDTSVGGDYLNYNFRDNDTIYLNVEVAAQSSGSCSGVTFETLSPRQRILSAGYAVNAASISASSTQSTIGTTTPAGLALLTIEASSTSAIPLLIRATIKSVGQSFLHPRPIRRPPSSL